MELRGKRVLVAGLGVSGLAAAKLLSRRGATLLLWDEREDIARESPPGELHLGRELPSLEHVELLVVSPGIPANAPIMRAARAARIPIIGEIELASRFIRAPIVAITGTNGKSTVTALTGEIFKAAGLRTFVGGNLGTPLSEAVDGEYDILVVEASSYQLETIEWFRPRVAVHLNLAEDHLDRHADFAEYAAAKARLFENQWPDDWAILNRDDARVWDLAVRVRARVLGFGAAPAERPPAIWTEGGAIAFDDGERRERIALVGFRLPGAHNASNAMAAAAAALALDVAPATIEQALRGFRGLPHRIELIREKNGVAFVDDSKGTNVAAAVEAIAAARGPVILIAGGVDKGGSYEPLRAAIARRARLVVLIGAAREKMAAALAGAAPLESRLTLSEAVELAAERARAGDTVLLSPACSSLDQFKNYAERGRVFQELVRAL
ncbi:MAG TPA: UDP-N-acetylmuramoyl-L-alanine--D-glutamate ligase [Candidatus Binataceae bacterium]|nr:UDP-N-acetylmuramoyl-L-alanine--D-glutamate ligase [Candidatus Binataceae bacterium]